MLIKTQYGDFADFRSLMLYMRDEGKDNVFISSCDYYGLECVVIPSRGITFTYDEICDIVSK